MRSNLLKKNLIYKIYFSDTLILDFKDILYFFEYNNVDLKYRKNIFNKIAKKMLSLEFMPERFKIAKIINKNKIRLISVDEYNIYYHVNNKDKSVRILRVLNAKTNQNVTKL